VTLKLPEQIRACLFDMDGVMTETATVHAAAWKQMFDEYLRERAKREGEEFVPFDAGSDYDTYVDGKPRYDGVRSFLESRRIELSQGSPSDPPDAETIDGLGNRKNELVQRLIHDRGVKAFPGSGEAGEGGPRGGTEDRGRVVERELQRGDRGGRDRGSVRRAG
jgi:beta-phosphoglucomutase-like phosphatase (HAD superfamily)